MRGRRVALPVKEYELLLFLARHPHRVYTREQLLHEVWRASDDWLGVATVTEHVRRLRRRIEIDGSAPLIETVRGVGYRFEVAPESVTA